MENWLVRSELLLGADNLEKLRNSKIAVVGLGGVGAYAAEMIARVGVGRMMIVDSDVVNNSNINRQLLALNSTIGQKKVLLMEKRLMDINPNLIISTHDIFINEDNIADLFKNSGVDYIVDAIDTLSPKVALIQYAVNSGTPIVSSMGAGAKYDVTKIRIKDISKSFNCPLAYMIRKRLRKLGINKGFKVVFSEELPCEDAIVAVEEQNKKSIVGTVSYLPAIFGCACAQVVIQEMVSHK